MKLLKPKTKDNIPTFIMTHIDFQNINGRNTMTCYLYSPMENMKYSIQNRPEQNPSDCMASVINTLQPMIPNGNTCTVRFTDADKNFNIKTDFTAMTQIANALNPELAQTISAANTYNLIKTGSPGLKQIKDLEQLGGVRTAAYEAEYNPEKRFVNEENSKPMDAPQSYPCKIMTAELHIENQFTSAKAQRSVEKNGRITTETHKLDTFEYNKQGYRDGAGPDKIFNKVINLQSDTNGRPPFYDTTRIRISNNSSGYDGSYHDIVINGNLGDVYDTLSKCSRQTDMKSVFGRTFSDACNVIMHQSFVNSSSHDYRTQKANSIAADIDYDNNQDGLDFN